MHNPGPTQSAKDQRKVSVEKTVVLGNIFSNFEPFFSTWGLVDHLRFTGMAFIGLNPIVTLPGIFFQIKRIGNCKPPVQLNRLFLLILFFSFFHLYFLVQEHDERPSNR